MLNSRRGKKYHSCLGERKYWDTTRENFCKRCPSGEGIPVQGFLWGVLFLSASEKLLSQ